MSYEQLGGLGAAPRRRVQRFNRSTLPHPAWTGSMKRRPRPHELSLTMPRLPMDAVMPSELSGLGFSLKPPKWVRKLTIKKVIKPLAITAAIVGAAFIPGALPFVGKAAGLLAKGAVGAGKFVGKRIAMPIAAGFMSKFKRAPAQPQTTVPTFQDSYQPPPPDPRPTGPSGTLGPSDQVPYSSPTLPPEYTPPTYAPSGGGGGGGGGYSAPAAAAEYGPQTEAQAAAQAGMGNSMLIPIGIGLVALIAVSGSLKRSRK